MYHRARTARRLMAVFLLAYGLVITNIASARDVHVRGYFRKDGTYVQPHYRSAPDGNPYNNFSFPGNVNPYTGKVAPGNPDTYLQRYYNRSPSLTLPAPSSNGSPILVPPDASGSVPSTPEGAGIPANAHVDWPGHGWQCNRGYRQRGGGCVPLDSSANSVSAPSRSASTVRVQLPLQP
jgi:hypothetical protein